MHAFRWLFLSCVLMLGGCLQSEERPFSTQAGDAVQAAGKYSCKNNTKIQWLIQLESNKQYQYVWIHEGDTSAVPITFHATGSDGVYLASAASANTPGEMFALVKIKQSQVSFFLLLEEQYSGVQQLAAQYNVKVDTKNSWSFVRGALSDQRLFLMALSHNESLWTFMDKCVLASPTE
ncbi:MAG: hypothetical protein P4L81_04360 [Candidatus Pacebacteria bacterium]|nr:hypothetical protein [Candidatus Paceibacterota bacterium]